jgi:uncharacterized membrane protein (Fun14 family)
VKTVGRVALVTVGTLFIIVQIASHKGWISVNWSKVGGAVESLLDQNGDGKFDHKDANILLKRMMEFLAVGLPSAAGFSAGCLLGLKWF